MKKSISLLLSLVLLIAAVSLPLQAWAATPPQCITLTTQEELDEMREMFALSDEELESYLHESGLFYNGITSRNDLNWLITTIRITSYLVVPEAKLISMNIYPQNGHFVVSAETPAGETYFFEHSIERDDVATIIENKTGSPAVPLYESGESNGFTVYASPFNAPDPDAKRAYYLVENSGFQVAVFYENKNAASIDDFNVAEIFGVVEVGVLEDWLPSAADVTTTVPESTTAPATAQTTAPATAPTTAAVNSKMVSPATGASVLPGVTVLALAFCIAVTLVALRKKEGLVK